MFDGWWPVWGEDVGEVVAAVGGGAGFDLVSAGAVLPGELTVQAGLGAVVKVSFDRNGHVEPAGAGGGVRWWVTDEVRDAGIGEHELCGDALGAGLVEGLVDERQLLAEGGDGGFGVVDRRLTVGLVLVLEVEAFDGGLFAGAGVGELACRACEDAPRVIAIGTRLAGWEALGERVEVALCLALALFGLDGRAVGGVDVSCGFDEVVMVIGGDLRGDGVEVGEDVCSSGPQAFDTEGEGLVCSYAVDDDVGPMDGEVVFELRDLASPPAFRGGK